MYDRKLCQLMMMERDTVAVTLTVWWTPSDTRHMSTVVRWSQPEPENQVLGSWIFTVKHFVVFYLNLKAFSLGKYNISFAEYNKGYCDIVTTMTMLWPGHQHWPVSGPGVVLQYSVHSNYSHGTMCQITTTKWKNIFIFKPKQILRLISLKWNTHHTTRDTTLVWQAGESSQCPDGMTHSSYYYWWENTGCQKMFNLILLEIVKTWVHCFWDTQ